MTALPVELQEIAELARPATLAGERVLPVLPALADLLPARGLIRGAPVAVSGDTATTLALGLAAGPSADGSWVAAVGIPTLGLTAAAELGVCLDRLVLVGDVRSATWPAAVAALVGVVDVVLLGAARASTSDVRKVRSRARESGAVIISVDPQERDASPRRMDPLEPDVWMVARTTGWVGLGQGHGNLTGRQVEVEVGGRRGADRPRKALLWIAPVAGRVEVTGE